MGAVLLHALLLLAVVPLLVRCRLQGLSWTRTKTNATAPHQLSCAVTFHERIVVIGHRFKQPTKPIKGGFFDVDVYNPSTGVWTARKGPPVKLHHINCGVDTQRDLIVTGMAFVKNPYPRELPHDSIYQFSPKDDTWTPVVIPKKRRRGSAAFAFYKGSYYFVYGTVYGHGQGPTTTKPWFDRYDPSTKKWSILPNAPPGVRDHAGGVVYKDDLFVLCGKWGGKKDFFIRSWYDVNVYNFVTKRWTQIRDTRFRFPHVASLPTLVYDGARPLIAVSGGVHNFTTYGETEFFDPTTKKVVPYTGLRMHTPRTAYQLASCRKNELYVVGGKFFAAEKVDRQNVYNGEYLLLGKSKRPKCGSTPGDPYWNFL